MNRLQKIFLLSLAITLPMILGGAVCSRALDLPIIVKATLPNEFSTAPFTLNVDKALAQAGITSTDGKIPANAPAFLEVAHTDVFNLQKQTEFQKYGARVYSAYINYVSAEIIKNNLTVNAPQLQLALAPLEASGQLTGQEKYDLVASLPPFAAGTIGIPAEVVWEENQFAKANQILKAYTIAVQLRANIPLQAGAPMPKGLIEFNLHFEATFVLKLL